VLPEHVSAVSDNYWSLYQFVSKKIGKQHPTLALFGRDTDSSKAGEQLFAVAATGTALKAVAAKGKSNITPDNVRKYASTMTWKIDGLQGPTTYPRTSVMSYPSCGEVAYSDGTKWIQQIPYRCSRKTYPASLKVG
jgi:hypothetical protein